MYAFGSLYTYFLLSSEADSYLAQTSKLIESKDFAGLVEKVSEKFSSILLVENDAGLLVISI